MHIYHGFSNCKIMFMYLATKINYYISTTDDIPSINTINWINVSARVLFIILTSFFF